jgi:hypothetical protein
MLGGALGIVLTPVLSYLWATYSDAYLHYGRAYFPVYVGCLLGLMGLYARRRGSSSEAENWGFGLTFVGLVLGLAGDVIAYWGGGSSDQFSQLQAKGFSLELIGLLLLLVGSVVLGVASLRTNRLPRLVAWLLILAGPGGILLSSLHAPSGTMLVFCLAYVVLGYLLLTGRVAATGQSSRLR